MLDKQIYLMIEDVNTATDLIRAEVDGLLGDEFESKVLTADDLPSSGLIAGDSDDEPVGTAGVNMVPTPSTSSTNENAGELVASTWDLTDRWFDWSRPSCFIFAFCDPNRSREFFNFLRDCWINAPTVLLCPDDFKPKDYCYFGFSAIVAEGNAEAGNVISQLIEQDQTGNPSPFELRLRFGRLGRQERRVLMLSLQGLSSKEIAEEMDIRYQTVDKYRRNALTRMRAKNLVVLQRQLFEANFHGSYTDYDAKSFRAEVPRQRMTE